MLLTPLVHDAIYWLVIVTTYSLVGIVAAWGALGRGHWFLRVAAVLLFLSAWLAAPESWFWATFALQSAIVMVVLPPYRSLILAKTAIDAKSAKPQRVCLKPTFSLTDLLLLTSVVGVVLAILSRAQFSENFSWRAVFGPGVFFALFTLAGALPIVDSLERGKAWHILLYYAILFPACLIGMWHLLVRSAHGRTGRTIAAANLLLIAAPPAVFYGWLIAPRFLSLPAPLENNGFDDVLRAAERIGKPVIDVKSLSDQELATLLDQHREALELARTGLARPCQMLLPREDWYHRGDLGERVSHRSLIQLGAELSAAARLQLLEERPDKAAECCFDAIRLGEVLMLGGTLGDAVIGTVIQSAGLDGLQRLAPRLVAADCRKLAERLAKLDGRQETADQILARDAVFRAKTLPWTVRWEMLRFDEFGSQPRPSFIRCHNSALARLRLFRCHLALREFWLAHGEYPTSLAELAPGFLADLPPDPFSGRNLVYRQAPDGYQLYSVGPDGIDDGGRLIPPGVSPDKAKGDIVLDLAVEKADAAPGEAGADPTQ